jgi:hypothetical protein
MLEKQISDGKTRHVWAQWREAKARDFIDIKDPETVWVPKWGESPDVLNIVDADTLTHGSVDGEINVWKFCPNETHPWVREVLARTSFRPRIMFRWCMEGCWNREW